jgi:hypothetical protein
MGETRTLARFVVDTSVLEASRATALIDAIGRLETVTDMAEVAVLAARR